MHEIGSAMPRRAARLRAAAALGAILIAAPVTAQTANVVEKHGDWTMYAAETRGAKLCFVTTQPTEVKPEGARRDPIHFYVSAWPKDGVLSEISIKLGYPLRKGSEPTVSIGTQLFKLFVKDDKAFIADPTAELKLIEAMKKGAKLMVEAVSERGTVTSDSYSLSGFDKAAQALATKCT